jgi:nucleoside-diphosphate-sugar epimerase
VIGCGYVGRELALGMVRDGWDVTGWTLTEASAQRLRATGLRMISANAADGHSWADVPRDFACALLCAATRGGSAEDYRSAYLASMTHLAAHVGPGTHLVFASSTSVYGQDDGSWVHEQSPAIPDTDTARVLLQAEEVCLAAGGAVARIAGIYGPGRSGPLRLLRSGEARIGPDGGRWMNQIHRDDVASALRFLGERRARGIFNVCDDQPVRQGEFYEWLADRLGLPPPPQGSDHTSRRGFTNKRVSNDKIRSLGWAPHFPSFERGYASLLDHWNTAQP